MTNKSTLHVATYLVPSISVEFFESLLQYLERKLGCQTTLRYESRSEGPLHDGSALFTGSHAVDVGMSRSPIPFYIFIVFLYDSIHERNCILEDARKG